MQLDYRQLAALTAVLRCGSFEQAAAELGFTSSALSQRIRHLEEQIGAVLIVRGTPCRPTPEGNRVYRHAQIVALHERNLLARLDIVREADFIPVSIALNPDSLATWFLEALKDIKGMLFTLHIDNQDQGTAMLSRGDVIAAVTFSNRQIQGCDAYGLGTLRYLPVARSDFRDTWFAGGLTPEAFARAPALTYNSKDRLQLSFATLATGAQVVPPIHQMADARGLAEAAAAGLGWVMLPHLLAEPLLTAGQLVKLSDSLFIDSPLTWQVNRASRTAVKSLTLAVRNAASSMLLQIPANQPPEP